VLLLRSLCVGHLLLLLMVMLLLLLLLKRPVGE